ncbi:MAG TPA: DUF402 domain-containing protein [Anaerolineales bacterium]|nr:DUF402 domain-containing protein [Anaerolineales bacterium]
MKVLVQKKNLAGEVTWKYDGNVLHREDNAIVLDAFFDRSDMPFMDVVLKKGDRFVETFYSDRWYNIFEIYDRDDGNLKGWYCNVGMPVLIEDGVISYVDLALDLWVSVDGKQTVLDEDEFEDLVLSDELRTSALKGLAELKQLFDSKNPPQ